MGKGSSGDKNKNDGGNGGGDPQVAYGQAPTQQTFQSFPGQQQAVADQIGGAFSGANGLEALLNDLYQPVTLTRYQEPISTTRSNYDADKHKKISTGNAALDRILMSGGRDYSVDEKKD